MTTGWIEFDLHNYARVRVARDAPTAPLLEEMFAPFIASGLEHHDLTITGRYEPLDQPSNGETEYQYTESALNINSMKVQILRRDGGFWLNGRRELLVHALPLIDWIMINRGAAMIHSANVDYQGSGVCLPAWGGTGKTSTIAKLLKIEGVSFMGDDWAFLTDQGELLGYNKPMFIKPHHRPIYPHLFAEKRKPLIPSRFTRSFGKLATTVHPVITTYPRLAGITRRWSPEHMTVTPEEAFPHAMFSERAPLAVVMFVERFEGNEPQLLERDTGWMVSRMIGNFHAELPGHSRDVITALAASNLVPIEQFLHQKSRVLARAIADTPAYLLKVPAALSPDRASDIIVERIEQVLPASRVSVATGQLPVELGSRETTLPKVETHDVAYD